MKRSKLLTIPRAAARLLPAPTHLRRLFVALVVLLTMTAQTAGATETSTITVASSEIALSIVSELHVRSVGCSERWGIRWLVTSSTQSPPQK